MRLTKLSSAFAILLFATGYLLIAESSAQEFRIDTDVYLGSGRQPVSHNITLFSDGVIYDFQMSPTTDAAPIEIAIFDSRDMSFVLVDPERNMRLEISHVELVKMMEGLRQQTSQDEKTSFLINDAFVEDLDIATGIVSLESQWIKYRFHGERPQDASILPAYFQFIVNFSQLNASDPRKLPPFPRMRLNQAIKRYGWIPDTVSVTLEPCELFRDGADITAKHTLITELSTTDRERIAETKTRWLGTRSVRIGEYREFETTTSTRQDESVSGN
ncbi:MAG: hypothetical protein AAF456_20715 [Planctomycetota bacterium]